MINQEPESICQKAEPYYYDYLSGVKPEDVPDDLWRHIDCCADCQTEIALLKKALENPGSNSDSPENIAAITANLELHFAHSGQPVACATVRPFLPTIADKFFEVRIPTPITAHINECKTCADDIESIRAFSLDHRQLLRLGQILAEYDSIAKTDYKRVRDAIESILETSPASATTDVLRQKVESLQQTILGMVGREESGIATCLSMKAPLQTRETAQSQGTYSGWPVQVDVLEKGSVEVTGDSERANDSSWVGKAKEKGSTKPVKPHFRRFVRPFAAAAAVLLLAMLAFHTSNLRATTKLSQIYENLRKVENVHVRSIDAESSAVSQEIWISRKLMIKMFKTREQYVLWDLQEKKQKTKNMDSPTISSVDVDDESVNRVAQTLTGPLNMLPFSKLAKLRKDSRWYRVDEETLDISVENMEVYELLWKDQTSSGSLLDRKWRGFIESDTKLPTRIEWYAKNYVTLEYELVTVTEVDYPATDEMRSIIREIGF